MPLFRLKNRRATRILPDERRRREDFIHVLIEDNLATFFDGLVFVARKPRIGGKEFDTLAFDPVSKSPVIIEYKREKDRGVVEQVSLYYVKLRNNKADVMVLFGRQGAVQDLEDVDFDHPQIIVVAKEFTPEQKELLGLMNEYSRLWQYQVYSDGILSLEEVQPLGSPVSPGARGRTSPRPLGAAWDVEHFGMKPAIRKLYDRLDSAITSLDSRIKPGKINKWFVGFGATGYYFCTAKPRVNSIQIDVKLGRRVVKTKELAIRKLPSTKHTPMTHRFHIATDSELRPALGVVRQAFEDSL